MQGSSIGQPSRKGPAEEAEVAQGATWNRESDSVSQGHSCSALGPWEDSGPQGIHWAAVPPACSLGTSLKDLLTREDVFVGTGCAGRQAAPPTLSVRTCLSLRHGPPRARARCQLGQD